MRTIQLVDLDGCIADDRWRRELILPRPKDGSNPQDRFHMYHSQSFRDEMRNREAIRDDCQIVVLTARSLAYRTITMAWLREQEVIPMFLIHRNPTDTRPSVDVKREQVRWLTSPNMYGIHIEEIVDAIDDLQSVVDMYRNDFGIASRLVRIGEEEHVA